MDIQFVIQIVIQFIDAYSVEIVMGVGIVFVLTFLIRSFKRSLLISEGRARLVLESFDDRTEKLNKWMSFIALFLLLPAIVYVEFLI